MDKKLSELYKSIDIPEDGSWENMPDAPKHLIAKRKDDYKQIMRAIFPMIFLSKAHQQELPPLTYRIAVVMPKGSGRTIMSKAIGSALQVLIEQRVLDGCGMFYINSNLVAWTYPESLRGLVPIVLIDGLPPKDKLEPAQVDVIRESFGIAFVESEDQYTKWVGNDTIVIKLDGLVRNDIMEMADMYDLLPDKESKEKREDIIARIDDMMVQDVRARTILDMLAPSARIGLESPTSPIKTPDNTSITFDHFVQDGSTVKAFPAVQLNTLRDHVSSIVIGQPQAVDVVVDAVTIAQYGLNESTHPMLRALFVGPTGVGKTSMCQALSSGLFGGREVIRIDMSEFSQPHHVAQLFGSGPGYVGYGTDTYFVSQIKRAKSGVIVLDEIEKAHRDIHNALLQVLDNGRFTTGSGEEVDVRKYFIIMTSNASSDKLGNKMPLGFGEKTVYGASEEQVRKVLQETNFSAEFLNRIDKVVLFNKLKPEDAIAISRRHMDIIGARLEKARGIKLTTTEDYHKWVVSKYDQNYGGRGIKRCNDQSKVPIVHFLMDRKKKAKVIVLDKEDVVKAG